MNNHQIEQMRAMYEQGASLRKVGEAFGISGARVHQLFERRNIPRRDRGGKSGGLTAKKTSDIVKEYLNGAPRRELASTYGVSLAQVNRILRANTTREEVRERNRLHAARQERAYDDWEMAEALLSCAGDLGDKFTTTDYSEWRETQNFDYPSVSLYNQRHPKGKAATWNEWRRVAGLPAGKGSTPGHGRQYTDEEIYSSLDAVAGRVGGFPTLTEYDEHRAQSAPKSSTIRMRYGRWGEVKSAYDEWKE